MWVQLYHRHYGVHKPCGEPVEIPCKFDDVVRGDDNINEDLLLDNIPDGYLPCQPNRILMCVTGSNGWSTGQAGLERFRDWAKYFDAYVIYLSKDKPGEG